MPKPKPAIRAASLEKQIGLLKRERNHFRDKCDDLSAQNLILSSNPVITPEQLAEFARLRSENESMRDQVNRIAKWLRDNKEKEIAAGMHAGKDLADVVIGYMAESAPKEIQ